MSDAPKSEQIVRALADASPDVFHSEGMWHACGLCDISLPVYPDDHRPDCPWRLAVEWVAAQDATPRG